MEEGEIEVTFDIPLRGSDPKQISEITIVQSHIPRKSEMVYLSVEIEDEIVSGNYRVADVQWVVKNTGTDVRIILQ